MTQFPDVVRRLRHITRLTQLLQLMAAAILAAACTDPEAARILDRADALMETHPDSALMLLQGVDPLRLNERDAASYNLLKTQACHKLDMELPSDSAISIAVDFYASEGPDSLLMKSLFYRACIHKAHDHSSHANKDITKAWDLAQTDGSHYWQAKIAEMTADMYEASVNMTEAVEWRRVAAEQYEKSGRIDNYLFALCDLASIYTENGDPERERQLLDTLQRKIDQHSEIQSIRPYYYFVAFNFYGYFGPFTKADSIYSLITSSDMKDALPSSLYLSKARILINEHKYDKAQQLLDSINGEITLPEDRNILFHTYYVLWKEKHKDIAADSYMDSLLAYQSALVNTALNQSVTTDQREYYQSEAYEKDAIIHKSRNRTIIIGVCILLFISAVSLTYLWKLRNKKREIREKAAIILSDQERLEYQLKKNREIQASLDVMTATNEALKKSIEDHDRQNTENEKNLKFQKNLIRKNEREISQLSIKISEGENRIAASFHLRWETLNLLCHEFYNMTPKDDRIIINNISSELKKFKSDSFYRSLETDLNRYIGDIIVRLRTQCSQLKEEDIRFCILAFAGLTPTTIAFLTDSSTAKIYVRRQRIRTRIIKANPTDRDEFVGLLKGETAVT